MRSGVCAVIVILILVSFSGCTQTDSDDEELPNYVYSYHVTVLAEDNQSYRLILPILMNNSGDNIQEDFILNDLQYPPPPFNFTIGTGTYSFVETEHGKGIEIIAQGSIRLDGVEHAIHPYGEFWQVTFLSLLINQSGEYLFGRGTPYLFHIFFQGDGNLTIELFQASLSTQMHVDRFYSENITLANGWNEVTIHYNFLS